MGKNKFSCALATYNQESFAYKAIESIAAQVDEVIVVDDCSHDQTFSELKRASKEFKNVKVLVNEQNLGVSRSFNRAVNEAQHESILLSAGDDMSLPNRRRSQELALERNPDSFNFSRPRVINSRGNLTHSRFAPEFEDEVAPRDLYFRLIFQGNFLCATSASFNKQIFTNFGAFDPNLTQLQDWSLWLIAARQNQIRMSSEPTSMYRKHPGNLSGNNHGRVYEKLLDVKVETAYILGRELDYLSSTDQNVSKILGLKSAEILHLDSKHYVQAARKMLNKRIDLHPSLIDEFIVNPRREKQRTAVYESDFQVWLESRLSQNNDLSDRYDSIF